MLKFRFDWRRKNGPRDDFFFSSAKKGAKALKSEWFNHRALCFLFRFSHNPFVLDSSYPRLFFIGL